MRDLLRQFATVPLALAAYNAGPAPVSACGCVPAFPETRGYVARILGLMNGAGEGLPAGPTQAWSCAWSGRPSAAPPGDTSRGAATTRSRYEICSSRSTWRPGPPPQTVSDPAGRVA